jgi:hypothetical protein
VMFFPGPSVGLAFNGPSFFWYLKWQCLTSYLVTRCLGFLRSGFFVFTISFRFHFSVFSVARLLLCGRQFAHFISRASSAGLCWDSLSATVMNLVWS